MNLIKKNKNFLRYIFLSLFLVLVLEILGHFAWNNIKSLNIFGVLQVHKALNSKEAYYLQRFEPSTYGLYWNNPNFRDREHGKQYDKNGYRNIERVSTEISSIKILIMGGSTTNSYPYTKDRNKIWTTLLEKKLSNYGIPVIVYNAGLPGGTTGEMLSNYLFNAQYLMPDLIIIHTGSNDIAPIMIANVYDYKTDYSHLRSYTGAQFRKGEITALQYSKLYRVLYAVWLKDGGFFRNYPKNKKIITKEEAKSSVIDNPPLAFQKNLEVLTTIAQSNNSRVLFAPINRRSKDGVKLWLKNNPNVEDYEEAYLIAMQKHKEIMKKIANDKNEFYFELDDNLFEDNGFIDRMHLNEIGQKEKARQIFNILTKNNIIQNLTK